MQPKIDILAEIALQRTNFQTAGLECLDCHCRCFRTGHGGGNDGQYKKNGLDDVGACARLHSL